MTPSALFLALTSLILWSFLAFLGAKLVRLPPLLVVGVALCVGGMVSAVRLRSWRVPLVTFLVGAAGIFGYHFLYFSAFKFAPVVEASLINYLWPLLIVLLSPLFLVGYSLRWHHLIGATTGFLGASLIVMGERFQPNAAYLTGYILAAGAALTWASYSLLTKRLPPFPTAAVGGFCLFGGLLSLGIYFLGSSSANQMILPTGVDWLYLILVGVGPMGLAFFTWDAALKARRPADYRLAGLPDPLDIHPDPGAAGRALIDLGFSAGDAVDRGRRNDWLPGYIPLEDVFQPRRAEKAGRSLPKDALQ